MKYSDIEKCPDCKEGVVTAIEEMGLRLKVCTECGARFHPFGPLKGNDNAE